MVDNKEPGNKISIRGFMVEKKSTKGKTASKPVKMSREVRRVRTMNVIFLVITAILILSLVWSAFAKF